MDKMNEFKNVALEMGYDPAEVDAFSQVANNQQVQAMVPAFEDTASDMGYAQPEIESFSNITQSMGEGPSQYADMTPYEGGATGTVPMLTQPFGARHPRYNKISGGVNRGADFGVSVGTPLFAPAGSDWTVVDAYSTARGRGMQNDGYGNSVLLQNNKTGETMRMSHLSQVGVKPGAVIKGGAPIGLSGDTGHVTGAHVDVEYVDQNGKLSNVLKSPYAHNFM